MKYRKSGLLLSPGIFESLYNELLHKFEEKYDISAENLMDYQLFGYGNYDHSKPNLKQFILDETQIAVNGKYLYNKYLEWGKGKSPIKFTREFNYVYFNAIGYNNISDFLKNTKISPDDIKEQESVTLYKKAKNADEYYVGYNQNEEGEVSKSKLILSKRNQKIKWILGYWENGVLSEYAYPGEIRYQENGMSFFCENSKNELDRSLFVAFYFDRRVKILPYLIGSYAGYDRDRKPVTGEVLFQRINDKQKMQEIFADKSIDPRIKEFILGRRWPTHGTLPQTLNDLPKQKSSLDHKSNAPSVLNFRNPFYLSGTYKMLLEESNDAHQQYTLTIDEFGQSTCSNGQFSYSGRAFIAEGSILSIHFNKCNSIPHSAHFLAFIGRYSKEQILWIKGSWHGLNVEIEPSTKKAFVINQDGPVEKQQIESIKSSTKRILIN